MGCFWRGRAACRPPQGDPPDDASDVPTQGHADDDPESPADDAPEAPAGDDTLGHFCGSDEELEPCDSNGDATTAANA